MNWTVLEISEKKGVSTWRIRVQGPTYRGHVPKVIVRTKVNKPSRCCVYECVCCLPAIDGGVDPTLAEYDLKLHH